jgi:serine/threonine protein phosphatase PrpC
VFLQTFLSKPLALAPPLSLFGKNCRIHSFIHSFIHPRDVVMIAVLDGHGGVGAAQYAKEHLPELLASELTQHKDPRDALTAAFLKTDVELAATAPNDMSGSTCVLLLVEHQTKKIWVRLSHPTPDLLLPF